MAKSQTTRGTSASGADRFQTILETAARLICEKGYRGASLQDIASACGLTKAGLYHHCQSKEHLLFEIMSYGMDLFEQQVLDPVSSIEDPLARLRACMARNIVLVTETWSKEVTIILHEHATLTGDLQAQINARKKRYVHFLERGFRDAMDAGQIRPVEPKVAAFSFLGQVLWIYKWFRPDGPVSAERLREAMVSQFFDGISVETAS